MSYAISGTHVAKTDLRESRWEIRPGVRTLWLRRMDVRITPERGQQQTKRDGKLGKTLHPILTRTTIRSRYSPKD